MKSEFAEWFRAQHGPRESDGLLQSHSGQMLRDEVQRGQVAAAELAARRLWDEKRQSALYAWTARDKMPNAELCRALVAHNERKEDANRC